MHPNYKSKFQLKPGVWVFIPTAESIAVGKDIKKVIEKAWKPPNYFFHLKKGGHVNALKNHLNNQCFIHLDIENFFGSINRTRVTRCLKEYFSYDRSRNMANSSTVVHPTTKKSILPFGFVQSPIIASLCLDKSALGAFLRTLSRNKDIRVSVYVDDIVLSTNNDKNFSHIKASIEAAANKAGFTLNEKKTEGPALQITAFNIELSNNSININPEKLEMLRNLFQRSVNDHQKNGILGYVKTVNETQLEKITD